jgi:hypothetical protein
MEDMLKLLAAALLGAQLAYWFNLMREGKERKRRFRAVVELIRLQIEAAPRDSIWDVHHNSIGVLQEQAAHVLNDIRCARQQAFRESLINYSKLTSESVPSFVNSDSKTFNPQTPAALQSITDPLANLIELADGHRGDLWLATRANKAAGAASRER